MSTAAHRAFAAEDVAACCLQYINIVELARASCVSRAFARGADSAREPVWARSGLRASDRAWWARRLALLSPRVVRALATLLDIRPTVQHALRGAAPRGARGAQGRSLLMLAQRGARRDGAAGRDDDEEEENEEDEDEEDDEDEDEDEDEGDDEESEGDEGEGWDEDADKPSITLV